MARTPQPSDYVVKVDGVGQFTFARRRMKDEISVQVEYARIIDGVVPTPWLGVVAGWLSALRVLTVRAPEGWDLDELDPLDEEVYAKLGKVHGALIEQERTFRQGKRAGVDGQSDGVGAVSNDSVLVSPQVQPATN